MPTLSYSLNEFCELHGNTHIAFRSPSGNTYIRDEGRYLFADGAYATESTLCDPPTERLALLQAKRKYLMAKGKIEAEARNTYKLECEDIANNYRRTGGGTPLPPANWKEALAAGKARIEAIAKEVVAIDAELNKFPAPINHAAAYHQKQSEAARKGAELLAEIRSA